MSSIHTKLRRAMAPALMLLIGATATTALAKTSNGEQVLQSAARIAEAEQILANLGYAVDNADGKLDFNSRHAIMAFQKVEGLKRTGVLTESVLEKMRGAFTPAAKHDGPAHVEVDITRQVLFMVNDEGKVTLIVPISSGSGEKYWDKARNRFEVASTPRGEFTFNRKVNGHRKAPLGTLYYPSYFKEGWAVHGSNSIPSKAASHGCVRVPRGMDKKLFGMMPIGMKIYIYD